MARPKIINQRLNGLFPLSYLGVNPVTPSEFTMHPRPPTSLDIEGFNIGDEWLDITSLTLTPATPPTAENVWKLVDKSAGVATWINFGSSQDVLTLTGDTGGAVSGDTNDNIFLLGTANRITTTGNPGTNTITWDIGSFIATDYVTDSGTAIPSNNILNVLGGTGVTTTGAGNTITIDVEAIVSLTFTEDTGTATPAANNINIFGTHGINTSGATDTVTVAINNAITLGDLANLAAGVAALTIATGDITFTATNNVGNLNMVNTHSSGNAGVVEWGGNRWIHNFGDNVGDGGNVFMGKNAGNFTLTTGTATRLVGIGQDCLQDVTTGTTTVGIGYQALANMTSGSANVAIGYWAMRDATTAAQNMCFGFASGFVMTTATGNNLIGDHSGNFLTTGGGNTGIGRFVYTLGSTSGLTTGNFNISIGDSSGQNFTGSESNNILLNSFGTTGDNNILRFGRTTGSGTGDLAKVFIQGIRGVTTDVNDAIAVLIDSAGQLGTVSSSKRYKENIQPIKSESVLALQPVSFFYKSHTNKKIQYGLIAEEVDKVMPELVIYKDDLPESVKYHDLPVLLLNEIKKLNHRIATLEERLQKEDHYD